MCVFSNFYKPYVSIFTNFFFTKCVHFSVARFVLFSLIFIRLFHIFWKLILCLPYMYVQVAFRSLCLSICLYWQGWEENLVFHTNTPNSANDSICTFCVLKPSLSRGHKNNLFFSNKFISFFMFI